MMLASTLQTLAVSTADLDPTYLVIMTWIATAATLSAWFLSTE